MEANVEAMPAKKKKSEIRGTHLGVRLTREEAKHLDEVARLFPAVSRSTLIRLAIVRGLAVIRREGIAIAPERTRT
jgi:hypothetical protein